jgi:lipase chaperone LimK
MFNRLLMLKGWLVLIVLAKALSINFPADAQIIQKNPQQLESFQEKMRRQQEEGTQQTQEQFKETWLRLQLQQPQLQQELKIQQQDFTQQRQELRRQQQLRLQPCT